GRLWHAAAPAMDNAASAGRRAPRGHLLGGAADDELLPAHTNARARAHVHDAAPQLPPDEQPIPRPEILDGRAISRHLDAGVAPRHEGVLDGNVTRSAPPEDALTRGEVDLLQQESQAKSSQSNHPGAERVIAMRTEAPSAPAHGDYSRYPATRSASKPRPPSVRRGAVRAAKGSGGDVLRRRSEDVRLGASSAGGARTRKRG